MKRSVSHIVKRVVGGLVMVTLVVTVLSSTVMLLWNEIIIDVVGVEKINILQAGGILLLCRILFGRIGPPSWRGGGRGPGKWRQKWKNMSDEERQELRARWRDRCGPENKE